MRGTKAKRLRRAVYGDLSLRLRKYTGVRGGTLRRDPLRQSYQKAKGRRGSTTATDTRSRVYRVAERREEKLAFRREQAEARKATWTRTS